MFKESDYSGPHSSLNSLMSEDPRLARCDARVEMIDHNLFHCNYVGAALVWLEYRDFMLLYE